MLNRLDDPTRYLFFTGKGGVGKTSLATATAVSLADRGRRVLLVSTDPASNLGQVLESRVTDEVAPVEAVPGLFGLNIDPETVTEAYRERVLAPVRNDLPMDEIRRAEEQLSGACTTEIASFDAFTRLLTDGGYREDFHHVVFDTAPTGHTLRLLELPSAWSQFIDENPDGASCLGPLSGLESQRNQYLSSVEALRDPQRTTLVLVSRPETTSLHEAARSSGELEDLGLGNQVLVVNGVFQASEKSDPLARALEERGRAALEDIPKQLRPYPRMEVPLQGRNLIGVESLRALMEEETTPSAGDAPADGEPRMAPTPPDRTLADLVAELEGSGKGLVMTMGKGGVGKTTLAAAIAVELARRGHPVHLSTTDPAAHIDSVLNEDLENLAVSRVDPEEETRTYVDHVMATKGRRLDEEGRKLLEEDLRSPCTEEVAVFHAFSRLVREANHSFVIVDTAPTGHTLLLLDQTGAYHREVERHTQGAPGKVTTPLMRLQDPTYTRLLLVTLPETTPVLEAADLQADLRRADIEPYAWIVNQSLAAAGPSDPLLTERARAEHEPLEAVRERHAARVFVAPWTAREPKGAEALAQLTRGDTTLAGRPT